MIDWNIVNTVATAVGVLFGAFEIRLSKQQSMASFENDLNRQYRTITMNLPVDILIGKAVTDKDTLSMIRENIYNYCDLCNKQIYFRSHGRISHPTWLSWGAGMRAHFNRPMFKKVYEEINVEQVMNIEIPELKNAKLW